MITARRYYFKPDAASKQHIPVLFRIAAGDINRLIAVDRAVASQLHELRLADPVTRDAQLEYDELHRLKEEEFQRIKPEGEAELERLRGAQRRGTPPERSAAIAAFRARRREVSKERSAHMAVFNQSIDFDNRLEAAERVLSAPNQRDRNVILKTDLKQARNATEHKFNRYHIDDYTQHGLKQARETSFSGQVEFRTFIRGYGTDLPAYGTLATGHSQTESSRRHTVKEFRDGAKNRVIRRMIAPDQWVWDPAIPKGERKRNQYGEFEFIVMNTLLRGTLYFHQAIPDNHCVLDCKLAVEVRSGNTHYYVVMTFMDKAESTEKQQKNSFSTLLEDFHSAVDVESATPDELKAGSKAILNLKGKLVKKINSLKAKIGTKKEDAAGLQLAEQTLLDVERYLARSTEIRTAAAEAKKQAKKLERAKKRAT